VNEARLYGLKAYALLLPTPFAMVDPAGEAAREGEILAWLKAAGVEVGAVDRGHLERCAREAHDALVPLDELAPIREVPRLCHPLSVEELPGSDLDAATLHPALLRELAEIDRPAGARWWYRLLWRTLMRHPSYTQMPADARMPDHTAAAHRSLTAALAGATLDGGRPALFALHVGPVQGFIKAARRTHDLSLGSYTVGYLAFAGARALVEALGPDVLINPDVSHRALADKLLFGDAIAREERPALLRAALMNRILAVLPDRHADRLGREAMGAISGTWTAMAEQARRHLDLAESDQRGFREQVKAHLEIDAVVQPWPGTNAAIREILREAETQAPEWLTEEPADHPGAACGELMDLAERVLAAHRRGVEPDASAGDPRPKCTVCGVREQMGPIAAEPWRQQIASRTFFEELSRSLQRRRGNGNERRASLQVVHGEGLCAVCLTKRFLPEVYYGATSGGLGLDWNKEQDRPLLRFPSTATIASAPLRFYLRRVAAHPRVAAWLDLVHTLHDPDALDFTPPRNLLRGLGRIGDDARLLSPDGTWLYESSYEADSAWRSHFADDPVKEDDKKKYDRIAKLLPRAQDAFRHARRAVDGKSASPYYAVIVLDGDRMGDWKSGRHELSPTIGDVAPAAPSAIAQKRRPLHPALHGELSRRVALLGIDLHAIVDRHLGRLVYHGGDDLLAFLPLATALPCLEEIRRSVQSAEHLGKRVTISAGVAVSHWREPLSRALEAAREAEATAKKAGRNRFVIHADKRSGETLKIVLPWTVETPALDVIPTLGRMLERSGDDEDGPPLAGAKAAYQLREELPALGYPELRDAFRQRVDDLVFRRHGGASEQRRLLRALLAEKDAKSTPDMTAVKKEEQAMRNAAEIVDLLLFLRFLLREEHGIVTEELIAELPKKEDMS